MLKRLNCYNISAERRCDNELYLTDIAMSPVAWRIVIFVFH